MTPRHSVATQGPSDAPPDLGSQVSFAGLVRHSPWALGGAIATAVVAALLSIAPFWLLFLLAQEAFAPEPDALRIGGLAAGAILLQTLRWALMAISHALAHYGAFKIQHQLRLALAGKLGRVPLSFLSGRGSGDLRRVLSDDVNALEGFLAHMLPDAAAAAAAPLMALAFLFAVDWRLALVALVPLPLALLAQRVMMARSGARMAEWASIQQRIANRVGEYVRGVHVVKSFGLSAKSFGELATAIGGAVEWVADYARDSAGAWVLFTGLLGANMVLVAPVGAWLHLHGQVDLATWVFFLLLAPAVLLPLLRLTFAWGEQLQRQQSMNRINDVLGAAELVDVTDANEATGLPDPTDTGGTSALGIRFAAVTHRYGVRLAVDGVDFTARAGRLTALVGPSGSGKSTLARLLPRLYEPESGQILLGGVDVRRWPLDRLLANIAIVFQEVQLFHGSVRDNLLIARPDALPAEVEAAARAARAHDFIMALPQGYDTPLGDRGARLSGGERQRLSIARALLKNAPVLVLDEATSYADAENEALLQQALAELCRGRTVLMIAHRLRTVMHADRIVVLDAGRVVGQGAHDELLRDCPLYRQLWNDHEQARDWTLGEQA